jgi:hypothetical protein
VALAVVLLLPIAVVAGWLERIVGPAIRTGPPIPPALESAVRYVRALPARGDVVAVAALGTPEGHWRFVNRAGEMLSVGTPDEMKRVVPVLYPEAKSGAQLAVYVTQDTVLRDRVALKGLPAGIDLSVVVGTESYRLLRRSDATGDRFYAEIRSNLVIEMGDRRLLDEALWQLERRLDKASLRVLALEPGGPTALPVSPRIDPASKRALVDAIDPARLAAAMMGVAGQTLVIVGRIDRDLIHVKPSSGPEHIVVAKDLFKAAAAADVNLIVLATASTPRQPGGRNWLWQKVQGMEDALRQARMADFLNALGTPGRRLAVVTLPQGKRAVLDLLPAGELPGAAPARPVTEVFSKVLADLTGRVATTSMQASLRSAERQQELDQRLLPGIPSEVQIAYGLLVVLGLLGVPISRAWWQRIWPPEHADDYAGHTGYWAARATRGVAFALVFVPLTAVVSAPYSLGQQVREAVTAPVRLLRRLAGSRPPHATPPPVRTVDPAPIAAARPEPASPDAAKPAAPHKPEAPAKPAPPKPAALNPATPARPAAPDDPGTAPGPFGADRPRFLSRR